MDLFNPVLVKTYQDILGKNPTSKVFCPLAQIYRLKKDLKQAKQICLRGITYNPSYSAGYITLAQICGEEDHIEEALAALNRARELSPDNPKIYQIFGELYQQKKDIEKTLWAFKMVLFLRPSDQTARKIVQQLEKTLFKKPTPSSSPPVQEENRAHIIRRKKMDKLQKLLTRIEKNLPMREH
ncbi:MAG: hypothetical protein OXB86_02515 [Bdellovibrionales bacterium]|nr:hypothetical protein [Bdellovibrionales bacterium]